MREAETFICFSDNGEKLDPTIHRLVPPETAVCEISDPRLGLSPCSGAKTTFPSVTHRVSELGSNPRVHLGALQTRK